MCALLTSVGAGHCLGIAFIFLILEAVYFMNNVVSTINILTNDILRLVSLSTSPPPPPLRKIIFLHLFFKKIQDIVSGLLQTYALFLLLRTISLYGWWDTAPTDLWLCLVLICAARADRAYADLSPYIKGYLFQKPKRE